MVNIKIICGCGQKYSFDVYPFNGRMPAPVQCPVCGMDGTAAANEIMARTLGDVRRWLERSDAAGPARDGLAAA